MTVATAGFVPTPLPGKQQPPSKPQTPWVGTPLARIETEMMFNDGTTKTADHTYFAASMGKTSPTEPGPVYSDSRAFTPLGNVSFQQAVERASSLSSERKVSLNFPTREGTEEHVSLGVALMQAADGAYFASALSSNFKRPELGAFASVDTGRANINVREVEPLHQDLRAIVGAYSWVNFTGEQIAPALAG